MLATPPANAIVQREFPFTGHKQFAFSYYLSSRFESIFNGFFNGSLFAFNSIC